MIIYSGISREFYPQTGAFGISSSFSLSSAGSCSLGVSGQSGYCGISLKNGKIYDNQNRFVYSYPYDRETQINLNVSTTSYDLYVNGSPVIFGDSKFTGISNQMIFVTSEEIDDFNYTIFGHYPSYSISSNIVFNGNYPSFSGYITNLDTQPIKIYSGTFDGNSSTFSITWSPYSLQPGQSGLFVVNLNQSGIDGTYSLDNTLYTNFGNIPISISISGYVPPPPPYSISLDGPSTTLVVTDQNYFSQFTSTSGQLFVIPFLQNVSGAGDVFLDIPISANFSTTFYGYLAQSGYLTGYVSVSGTGQGGGFNLTTTGILTGQQSVFAWATGQYSGNVSMVGYGYVSLPNYVGPVTGLINTFVTGTIYNGSGYLYVNRDFTKTLNTVYTAQPTSFNPSTGAIYYNTPMSDVTSDILFVNTDKAGIVYGFHYNSIDELVSYLNNNTGTHGVTAYKADSNTIYLSSLLSTTTKNILLQVDRDNDGTMAVSAPFMTGGAVFGLGSGINFATTLTGHYSGNLIKSGNYSLVSSGTLSGFAPVKDATRNFIDNWNLYTGADYFNMTSFKDNGYYNGSGFNSSPVSSYDLNGFYLKVSYLSYDSRTTDVARLVLSGIGPALGYYAEIYITGTN